VFDKGHELECLSDSKHPISAVNFTIAVTTCAGHGGGMITRRLIYI